MLGEHMTEKIFRNKKGFGSQKIVFLYALIASLIVFNIGIFMGYMLESSRIENINSMYSETEIKILDQITQINSMAVLDLGCESLIEENIKFGDKIFSDARMIQKYEEANILSDDIIMQHKRFDLLRSLFWINSIKIKQKCNSDYHNVVYFYKYNNPSLSEESEQNAISNLLIELKQKYGDKVMLIPIAGDNDIPSVNLLLDKYDINEFPVVLIDEKFKISDAENLDDIEKYFN